MTRFSKLKKKIEQDKIPRDISFDEISRYLKRYGYLLDRVNGSHHIFKNKEEISITIPVHNGRIKYYYVKKAAELIKEDN